MYHAGEGEGAPRERIYIRAERKGGRRKGGRRKSEMKASLTNFPSLPFPPRPELIYIHQRTNPPQSNRPSTLSTSALFVPLLSTPPLTLPFPSPQNSQCFTPQRIVKQGRARRSINIDQSTSMNRYRHRHKHNYS